MTIHKEKRVIHHRPQDLHALVADVRSYPEFLPWCLASRIRQESADALTADLIIGFFIFNTNPWIMDDMVETTLLVFEYRRI